ncbi:MAG: hypothetical protein M3R38_21840 [Actinomycetota bacterium]|nr:hypothetical protein [Actinomycetota bacterium]
MPTKAKDRTGEIEERLADLEQKRQRAAGAILEADNEAAEIRQRQDEIAVAAVSEEPEALEEMGVLEEALVVAARRGGVARSAVGQLEGQIERAREDLAEAEREVHREAFDRLAKERRGLEEQLEEQLGALLEGLTRLRDLDQAQRQEAYLAGVGDAYATHMLAYTVRAWLVSRLGGHGRYLELPVIDHYRERTLAELDVLTRPLERD